MRLSRHHLLPLAALAATAALVGLAWLDPRLEAAMLVLLSFCS